MQHYSNQLLLTTWYFQSDTCNLKLAKCNLLPACDTYTHTRQELANSILKLIRLLGIVTYCWTLSDIAQYHWILSNIHKYWYIFNVPLGMFRFCKREFTISRYWYILPDVLKSLRYLQILINIFRSVTFSRTHRIKKVSKMFWNNRSLQEIIMVELKYNYGWSDIVKCFLLLKNNKSVNNSRTSYLILLDLV